MSSSSPLSSPNLASLMKRLSFSGTIIGAGGTTAVTSSESATVENTPSAELEQYLPKLTKQLIQLNNNNNNHQQQQNNNNNNNQNISSSNLGQTEQIISSSIPGSLMIQKKFPLPSSMQDLIPTVNRLMDVFHAINQSSEGLDLPQIVVVGSQSSGKSSVLENIVQKDFLPRGKDIVTRRPLVLQLINLPSVPAEQQSREDYAEFLHLPNQHFTDFNLVREEIDRETERVAGHNKGISKIPIHLRIYSTKVLNLTLVDLPGITKIPIGDQPADIETKIKKLVMEYVARPNSIILAVSPANQDIANSDALKLAREVDPEGKRTIGVLTKLDLMDSGTNALDILNNKAFPLRLGFTGLVNRSQQDIVDRKSIKDALAKEELFFRNHPAYRSISARCGTGYLAKTLNSILMHHIRERLPDLKSKLNLMIIQTEQELSSYGDATFTGKAHQGSLVLKLLTKFGVNFNSSIDGTILNASNSELSGGARLYYIFNSIFGASLEKIDPCQGLSVHDIRTAIRNSTGPRPSLFIPELAFDLLIKPQLKRLEAPSVRCVELVFDELLKIVTSCETKELSRFPRLHQRVVEVAVELLRERMSPTQMYIESLISIQMSYINTNHPDFLGGSGALALLDRKHDKRRRDGDRQRRNISSSHHLHSQVSKEGQPSTTTSTQSSTAVQSTRRETARSTSNSHHHHHHAMASGKDGGFLTYFFGNTPTATGSNSSPEPPQGFLSRSDSPSRHGLIEDSLSLNLQSSRIAEDDASVISLSHPSHSTSSSLTEKEEMEVELIRSLIQSYFAITRKTIADLVPKTIMHLIVNYAKENIQNRLVTHLYREDLFAELLMEDEKVMREREKCKELLDVFRRASVILQDIF